MLPAGARGPGAAPAPEGRNVGLQSWRLTELQPAPISAMQCLKNRINTSNDVSCKFSMSRKIARGPSSHICCYSSQTTWPSNLFWSLIRQNPCDLWGWASWFWKEIIWFTRRKALAHCFEVCGHCESHAHCAPPAEKVEMLSFVPVISLQ